MEGMFLQIVLLSMSTIAVILFSIIIYLLLQRNKKQTSDREKDILQSQQETADLKNKLMLALQAGDMLVWSYLPDGEIFDILDQSTFRMPVVGLKDLTSQLVREDQNLHRHFVANLVEGRHEKASETFRMIDVEGHTHWYEVYAMGVKDDKGKVVRIIGTQKEVTAQAMREMALRKYIQRSELAIRSANIIQWDYDVHKRQFSRLFVDPSQPDLFIRKPFIFSVHPEDRLVLKHEEDLRAEGKEGAHSLHLRVMMEGDNDYRWVNSYAVPLEYDEDGTVTKLTGLQVDITSIEKAEESNRMKSAFLANMSHEIRTPLNAIVGFSQLLMETEKREEQIEFMRIIENNNNQLLQIINDILDISKIEAGKMKFSYSNFDLSQIIIDLHEVYQSRMEEGVELICHVPYKQCMIYSDKNRLTQVLSNLLSNATKFTSKGSVTIGYERIDNGLSFYITDTGKGISQENLLMIFDRFTKLDSFIPGTGLGLSICQLIVHKLGGHISVESELGKGSTFRFTIACQPQPIQC